MDIISDLDSPYSLRGNRFGDRASKSFLFGLGGSMEKDDENFELMTERQNKYMKSVREEALKSNVKISQWEWEEIEMAFEHGFAQGFIAGYQSLRQAAREGTH